MDAPGPEPAAPALPRPRGRVNGLAVVRASAIAVGGFLLLLTLAVPRFGDGCFRGHESGAIATLRSIARAQERFCGLAVVDRDGDGVGETGTLRELSAGVVPRGAHAAVHPPLLSSAFQTADTTGTIQRSGYRIRMLLPTGDGHWSPSGADADHDGAEGRFVCLAWPRTRDEHARRTFAVDQTGTVLACDVERFAGGVGPEPDALPFRDGVLVEGRGSDGVVWQRP